MPNMRNAQNLNNKLRFSPYSFSKINTFFSCPKKFEFVYIIKPDIPFKRTPALNRGNFVHMLLEYIDEPSGIQKMKETKDYKRLMKYITDDEKAESIEIVKNFKKSKIGKWLAEKETIANELSIGLDKDFKKVPYDSEHAIFRGYIDKVVSSGEKLICIDYKTGKHKPDMKWDQLLYYAIALFELMPYDEIVLMNVFVEHAELNKAVLKRSELKKYKTALLNNINKIETITKFEKKDNFCNWCEFKELCDKSTN